MTDQSHLRVEDKIKAAARAVEPNSGFSESLWQQLSQKEADWPRTLPTRRGFVRTLRVAALALPVIALVLLIIGPQKIVTAFNSLFGYLPDAGFIVDEPSTLYLTEPMTMEQEGVKLTVEQVVADRNHVVVSYRFTGLPKGEPGCTFNYNALRLPNGRTSLPIGGGVSGGQAHIYYQPLPEGIRTLTLMVSQQSPDPSCPAPQNWSIDLMLGPLPTGATLMPVTQGQDLQVSTQTAIPATQEESTEIADIHFAIDKIAELSDEYVVSGHVSGSNPTWNDLSVRPDHIQLRDGNGKAIPIEQSEAAAPGIQNFAFQFAKGNYANPLTIEFQSVFVSALFDEGDTFAFNAGAQPQVGQSWSVNKSLNLLGHEVTIESVSAIHDDAISKDSQLATSYAVQIKADSDVLSLQFLEAGNLAAGKGSSTGSFLRMADGTHTELAYPDGLPTGTITYQVRSMQYLVNGSWQLQLQLPSATP